MSPAGVRTASRRRIEGGASGTAPASPSARTFTDPALWLAVGVHVAACWRALAARPLWLDEAFSALMARKTPANVARALVHDAGPPLYYDLLHGWRWIFGESERALRSMSLAFSVLALLLLYRVALVLFGRWTARLAVVLWAVHPLAGFYAAEARNYTLFACLALVFAGLVLGGLEVPARLKPAAVGVTLAALAYNHNLGWVCAGAVLASALVMGPRTVFRPWSLLALALATLAYVPWLPTLRSQLLNAERNIFWMRWLVSPWLPAHSLATFTPFGRKTFMIDLPDSGGLWPAVVLLWLLPVAASFFLLRGGQARSARRLGLYLTLGIAVPALWTLGVQPLVMPGRTDFFLLPAFLILVAAGLAAAPRPLGIAGAVLLVASGAAASWMRSGHELRFDERAWADVVRAQAKPGDVVICTDITCPAALYYLEGVGVPVLAYPRDMALELAHFNDEWYLRNLDLPPEASAVVSDALGRLREGGTVWVVATRYLTNRALFEAIALRPALAPGTEHHAPQMGLHRAELPVDLLSFKAAARESVSGPGGAASASPPRQSTMDGAPRAW